MVAENNQDFNPTSDARLTDEFLEALHRDRRPVSVTWAKAQKQFKKCIGTRMRPDGTIVPRIFYLGSDHDRAVHLARCLMLAWGFRSSFGAAHWTEEIEQAARSAFDDEQPPWKALFGQLHRATAKFNAGAEALAGQGISLPENVAVPALAVPLPAASMALNEPASPAPERNLTLEDLADRFIDYLESRQVSLKRTNRMKQNFKLLYEILPAATALDAIDRDALQRATGYFARPKRKRTGRPLCRDGQRTASEREADVRLGRRQPLDRTAPVGQTFLNPLEQPADARRAKGARPRVEMF